MATTVDDFLTIRAQQLAILHLTRRNDLAVYRRQDSHGRNDLFVSLSPGGKITSRDFAVLPQGRSSPTDLSQANTSAYRDAPYPVCLFSFTMEDDRGYWQWIREPVLDTSEGRLRSNVGAELMPLTDQAVDDIILAVNHWYEEH